MANEKIQLIGCGILKKEIELLIKKNNWPLETHFLGATLHLCLDRLYTDLNFLFDKLYGQNIIVFYGCCHPLMESILEERDTIRTIGENCIEMLLGEELFKEELSRGAFFVLESWAKNWEYNLIRTFGTNKPEIIRELFKESQRYLLCLKTPCSMNFTAEAEEAGKYVNLPVRWIDVQLENLESVVQSAITRKLEELQWRK